MIRLGDGTDESHARMQRALGRCGHTRRSSSARRRSTVPTPALHGRHSKADGCPRSGLCSTSPRCKFRRRPLSYRAAKRSPRRAPDTLARRDAVLATRLSELRLVMPPRYHSLRIAEVRPETPECISVKFDLPPELAPSIDLCKGSTLDCAQRSTVKSCAARIRSARGRRRRDSGCDQESRRRKVFALGQRGAEGRRSDRCHDARGSVLHNARFRENQHYAAFVAGSGITPVLSLIRTTLAREPKSRFTLVYGNRRQSSVMFHEALEDLKDRYLTRFCLYNVFARSTGGRLV